MKVTIKVALAVQALLMITMFLLSSADATPINNSECLQGEGCPEDCVNVPLGSRGQWGIPNPYCLESGMDHKACNQRNGACGYVEVWSLPCNNGQVDGQFICDDLDEDPDMRRCTGTIDQE